MPQCEQCGNDYDEAFIVTMKGKEHFFDCFECAITALVPECAHCNCKVIGHGVTKMGTLFCCDHCARSGQMHPQKPARTSRGARLQ
jgi:hypothetical protein